MYFNMQLYCFRSHLVLHCYAIYYEMDLEACSKIPAIIAHGATGLNSSSPSHFFTIVFFKFSLKWWQSCPPILFPCPLTPWHL